MIAARGLTKTFQVKGTGKGAVKGTITVEAVRGIDVTVPRGQAFGFPRAYCRAKADDLLEFAQLTEKADSKVTALSGSARCGGSLRRPMSLFSASFFPIGQLPWTVRWLAVCSPLWHGNELARDAALGGSPAWRVALHLAVLVALFVAGFAVAWRRFQIRLTS